MKKQFIHSIPILILLAILLPNSALASTFDDKIAELRNRFPGGAYWDHQVPYAGYDAFVEKDESWQDSVTNTPCNHSAASGYYYDCNYFDGGSQCWGFAAKIFYEVFGVRQSWMETRYDTENVQAGDYIRVNNDSHSAFVLARNGNSLTVVECNYNYVCDIRWDRSSVSVGSVSWFKHASNYDEVMRDDPIPPPIPHPVVSVEEGTYIIYTALDNSKCLDVSGGSTANGANIILFQYSNEGLEKFNIIKEGNGYNIVNTVSGKCIDVDNSDSTPGTNIQQWEHFWNEAQRWYFEDAGDGYYYIRSEVGTYMDVANGDSSNGTNIWTYSFNGSNAQKFKLVKPSDSVSFSPWGGSETVSPYVGDTDAIIGQTISISGGNPSDSGIYLYDSKGNHVATGSNGQLSTWWGYVYFKINEECNYVLSPGTTYKYKFYVVLNGKTYWSNEYSFTTTGYSIELDLSKMTLAKGAKRLLAASVAPTGTKVIWSSDRISVATVNNGEVTAVGIGEATITAKAGDKTASCKVTVIPRVNSVIFDANGGTGTMSTKAVADGDRLTLPACAFTAPLGKQFKTWRINYEDYSPGSTYTVTGPITVTAVWESIHVTGAMSVALESKAAAPGGTVDVAITVSDNPGVALTQFQVSFDSALTLETVEAGTIFSASDLTPGAVGSNPYTVMFVNTKENRTGNGILAVLRFRVSESAVKNSVHTLNISGIAADVNEKSVGVSFTNGSVTISAVNYGDINADGVVNGLDVLRLGKFLTGWNVTIDRAAADVNGDGQINGLDQLRLAKYCAGWPVTLGG